MRPLFIGLLAIFPLLALNHAHFAYAQEDHPDFLWDPRMVVTAGVTPGEFLRISSFNPDPVQDGLSNTIILTESGHTLFESGDTIVPPLQTVFFDLDGDSRLLDQFRDASGRVQLSAVGISTVFSARKSANARLDPKLFSLDPPIFGLELVDATTGRTTIAYNETSLDFLSRHMTRSGSIAIGTTLALPAAPIGVSIGDLLRLTAFNPDREREGRVRFTLFAPDGTPVASSDLLSAGPLQTVAFELAGDDRSLDEFREASGRVQFSVKAEFPGLRDAIPYPPGLPLVIGAELLEEATGRTRTSKSISVVSKKREASQAHH